MVMDFERVRHQRKGGAVGKRQQAGYVIESALKAIRE
jgi:hypothetical protein